MKGDSGNPSQDLSQDISQELRFDVYEDLIVHVAVIYIEVNAIKRYVPYRDIPY